MNNELSIPVTPFTNNRSCSIQYFPFLPVDHLPGPPEWIISYIYSTEVYIKAFSSDRPWPS